MSLYPLGLRITAKPVLVVGGGAVGTRRIKGLLEAGALVTLISPQASAELAELAMHGKITWHAREAQPGDTDGMWLVHTATGVQAADEMITAECDANRILCVNASVAERSTAWVPAVTRHDGLTVATLGGGDPRRSMALRDRIGALLRSGAITAPASRPAVLGATARGSVALVGGGPGDLGLITVRGQELLRQATVVVADRLGPTDLLDTLAPGARVINVGKLPNHHPIPQDEINRILVAEAVAGERVVRLKGGDPYVLGRGGEELDYCREHGIEAEVVPGITSAISVPAAVGIPVTHRGVATGFTVITGHEALTDVGGGRDHTLVILMGVSNLAATTETLAKGLRGPECPVAIIEDGFGTGQRVTFGTLGTLAEKAQAIGVKSPAVIVIGDVVLRSHLAPASFTDEIELGS